MDRTAIINEFEDLRADGKISSMTRAAKSMGISAATLSNFLNNKSLGDIERISKKVNSFNNLIKERTSTKIEENPFVSAVENSKLITQITRLIHIKGGIGIIIGSAGLGKTSALKNYIATNEDAIYIKANLAFSAKVLLEVLANICGYSGKGHNYRIMMKVIEVLKNSGRLVIIDQAEYLSEKSLDIIREIQEEANIGLVLAGLPVLLENLRGRGSVNEQLITRVDALLKLKKFSNDDTEKIINAIGIDKSLNRDFIKVSKGNGRRLNKLIVNSMRIAKIKNTHINGNIILTAANQLVE